LKEGGVRVFSYETGEDRTVIRPNLEIGKLPALRVIDIDSLLLHEEPDEERWKRLEASIRSDGLLKHPPIAARDHGSSSHILLDGVNRVEAMRRLGARRLLIQEVDLGDDTLVLSTWHHVMEGLEGGAAVERIGASARISKVEGSFTGAGDFIPHFDRDTECMLVLKDRSTYAVRTTDDLLRRLEIVRAVAAVVHEAQNRDRVSYTNMADLAKHYRDFNTLVCYKAFTKDEVLALSLEGRKFPSGVTRFSIPKRALYFDLPFSFLEGEGPVESKQEELDELIREKIRQKKIRFYVEPTFIFDD
jgi:hypothetical protein